MSRRQINKMFGREILPSPSDSDDEFQPQYVRTVQNSLFGELSLSSHSESRQDSSDTIEEKGACALKPRNKKKKKKQNKSKPVKRASLVKNSDDEMDEIDWCVQEVNELLGSPPPPSASFGQLQTDPRKQLMRIQQKYLNSNNELRRWMQDEQRRYRPFRQLDGDRVFQKNVIVEYPDKTINFQSCGLTMSIQSRDGNVTYFTYDHSDEYQHIQRHFFKVLKITDIFPLLSGGQIQNLMHIEGLLEVVDTFFMAEEYDEAELLLEKTIACLQYTVHPTFALTDANVRLEYKYLENRPFFIAILKYIYLLSNKSFHRNALELAKLLLNLDPSDPLKMFLIIDIVALRAREHQWLVDVIDTMVGKEKHPELIITLKYSYALARFHVARKQSKGCVLEDTSDLDKLLQDTILNCPIVVKELLKNFSGIPKVHLEKHVLFSQLAVQHTGPKLAELIKFYARMVAARWREPKVLKWFLKNVNYLVDTFSPAMEATVIAKSKDRSQLFNIWPSEVVRHMTIIKSMSELISDGVVPPVKRANAFNPVPPLGSIDRYNYSKSKRQVNQNMNMNTIWHDLLFSAIPRNVNM